MNFRIEEVSGSDVLPLLVPDPRWTAYGLGDLDPPYAAHARWIAAHRDDVLVSALLVYRLPGVYSVVPFGDPAGIGAILAQTRDLPSNPFLIVHPAHVAAIERAYGFENRWLMTRMTVRVRDVPGWPAPALPVRLLAAADEPAVRSLYDHWGGAFFDSEMFSSGVYAGAWDGKDLVSGTHVVARRQALACIGGVFTRPDCRGQGLATATTGIVTRALADLGIGLLALNVRTDNAPARSAYRRLGFTDYLEYWEGQGERR